MIELSETEYNKSKLRFMGGIPPILIDAFAESGNLSKDYAYYINMQGGVYAALKAGIYKEPISRGVVTKFDAKELGEKTEQMEKENSMTMGGVSAPNISGPSMG